MAFKYRIYPNGNVIEEDVFEEYDMDGSFGDDFELIEVPEEVHAHIIDCSKKIK